MIRGKTTTPINAKKTITISVGHRTIVDAYIRQIISHAIGLQTTHLPAIAEIFESGCAFKVAISKHCAVSG